MRTALACLCALLPLSAAATYPVEVEAQMNGLAIEVLTSAGTPLVVTFSSKDKADATCTAELSAGLDTPQERQATVKAGKSVAVTLRIVSTPNRVRVKATCTRK